MRELAEEIAKDILKAEAANTGGGARRTTALDEQVTISTGGQNAARDVGAIVAATQSTVAPLRR